MKLNIDNLGCFNEEESFDPEEAAVDLMTNILHMLDLQYGLEPEAAQRMAWHHFVAEKHEATL